MELVIVLLIAGGFAGIWFLFSHWDKKRRAQVVELSQQLGLELHWQLPSEDLNRFQRFELAGRGSRQSAAMTLIADNGTTRICLFDYSFVTGNGKNQSTHHWIVAQCQNARLNAPVMKIEPETLLSRVGAMVGFQDIDVPEDPEFSGMFVVQGTSEDAIRKFLTSERRAALRAQPKQRTAMHEDTLILISPSKKLNVAAIKPLLTESLRMVNSMVGES